jgi:hypothetical protein
METTLRNLQKQLIGLGLTSSVVDLIVRNTIETASIEGIDGEAAKRLQTVLTDYVDFAVKCKSRTRNSTSALGQSSQGEVLL